MLDMLLKLITAENFAMVIALYLLVKTTGSIEKLTKCMHDTCSRVQDFTEKVGKVIETWEKRMWVYDMHVESARRKKEEEEVK